MKNLAFWIGLQILVLWPFCHINGQLLVRDTIRLSGAVLGSDSLQSLAGVHIYTQKGTGTISAGNGFFMLTCNSLDTLNFSFLGYKPYRYIVPDTLSINSYLLGIVLHVDTVELSEVIIFPWMNPAQFKNAFINHPVDKQTQLATQNLKIMSYTARSTPQTFYPGSMADYQLQQYSQDVEYRGMISPNDQLNVVGLATMLFYYAHQSITNADRKQKIDEELRRYLQQNKQPVQK